MTKRLLLYIPVGEKHLDKIGSACIRGIGQGFTIPVSYFKSAGNRQYYGFGLEIKNGKEVNHISGSATAAPKKATAILF